MGAVGGVAVIVAVCLNPALDVTYEVPRLCPGGSHAVRQMWVRPGGKGTNVARVLRQTGAKVRLVAPLGGPSGAAFLAALDPYAIDLVAPQLAGGIRTCVTVVDDDATVFNEPGPHVQPMEWEAIASVLRDSITPGDVVVLSGSVAPGVPEDAYAQIVAHADSVGARSVVDARGELLATALDSGPDLVAPNVHEAADLVGVDDPLECARALCKRGAGIAVVSAGPQGVVATDGAIALRAAPPRRVAGNPTGAGDALTARLAAGLHDRIDLRTSLCDALATAASAVATAVAGEIDAALRAELLDLVTVTDV